MAERVQESLANQSRKSLRTTPWTQLAPRGWSGCEKYNRLAHKEPDDVLSTFLSAGRSGEVNYS